MSKKIEKYFRNCLNEAEVSEVDDQAAFDAAMDDETDPSTFSVEPQAPGFKSKYIDKAKTWIKKIEQFSDWVNGMETDSLNKSFNDLDYEGSPFEGISRDSHTLTKIAEDLAALSETIKGYILSADNKAEREQQSESVKKNLTEAAATYVEYAYGLNDFWHWLKRTYGEGVILTPEIIKNYEKLKDEQFTEDQMERLNNEYVGKKLIWSKPQRRRYYRDEEDDDYYDGDFYDTEEGLRYRQEKEFRRRGPYDPIPPSQRPEEYWRSRRRF